MSKRLQVLLQESELAAIRKSARRHKMTTAEWVRQALRAAQRREPRTDVARKLAVIRAAEVFAITAPDVERAKAIVLSRERLSARDGLHAAVMEREGVTRIMTFDAGFDGLPGITRLGG